MFSNGTLPRAALPDIDSAQHTPKFSINTHIYNNGNAVKHNRQSEIEISDFINNSGLFHVSPASERKQGQHVEMDLYFERPDGSPGSLSHILFLCTLTAFPMVTPYSWDATFTVYSNEIAIKEYKYSESVVEYWSVLFVPTLGLFSSGPRMAEKNIINTFITDLYEDKIIN